MTKCEHSGHKLDVIIKISEYIEWCVSEKHSK